ncbi:MAG: hypothetical protein KGL39_17030 [Patescibacteria group bacterium]|nr:hypothetical protein [Patescibacteria group bacterium]
MLATRESVQLIEAELKRLGVAATNSNPTGIVVQAVECHSCNAVQLADDWVHDTYAEVPLLEILKALTDPEDLWDAIAPARQAV